MIATDSPNPRRLALRVVLGQAAVTLIGALLVWGFADVRAAVSALLGGGISVAGTLVMALLSFGGQPVQDPYRAIRGLLVGEAAKVAVVIVLFVVVLKTMKVVPLAVLGTYIATFMVFWIALARSVGSGGARKPATGAGT